MPTIVGSQSGTRPYLELDWDVLKQETANNRSQVQLKLYLKVVGSISYTARGSGRLTASPGGSYTYSAPGISMRSSGRYLLKSQTLWINHDSDGNRTVNLSANYALNITWNGTYHGTISLSGSASLPSIDRLSTITIKDPNTLQKIDSAYVGEKIRISLNRPNNNYKSTIGYTFFGNEQVIASNIDYNQHDFTIPEDFTQMIKGSDQNGIRFWVKIYDNGKYLGTNQTWMTIKVPTDVKPIIQNIYITDENSSLSGNQFVANYSQIKTQVVAIGVEGSSIKTISQRIDGRSTTDSTYNWGSLPAGNHTLEVTVTDTRGRSTSTTRQVNVINYSLPRINYFIPARAGEGTNTTVKALIDVSITSIGIDRFTITGYRRQTGTMNWEKTLELAVNDTRYRRDGQIFGTNFDIIKGYDLKLEVTDSIGTSTSIMTVSTSSVVMSWGSQGVGIGKIVEDGRALDVKGDIYANESRVLFEQDIKTGSNANGYWVRFSNGLQICYNPSCSINDASTSNSIGAIYRSPHKQIDFPIEFASAPSVSYEPVNEWQTWVTSNGATNTYDKVVIYSGKRDIMCSSVSFIAIGRWK